MNKLLGLDAGCVIRFSHPLDCFGNAVQSRVGADGQIGAVHIVVDRADDSNNRQLGMAIDEVATDPTVRDQASQEIQLDGQASAAME